jgi:protein SCO1/2
MLRWLSVLVVALPALAWAKGPEALFEQPWQWRDERGQTVQLSAWRGQPLVVTMFYRGCETRCPMAVDKLKGLEKAFARQGKHPHFLMITLDPSNDTPARLLAFKKSRKLAPEFFHLLNGNLAQTRELSRLLDVRFVGDDPHIDHETKIFLYGPRGELRRSFQGWSFDDAVAVAAL